MAALTFMTRSKASDHWTWLVLLLLLLSLGGIAWRYFSPAAEAQSTGQRAEPLTSEQVVTASTPSESPPDIIQIAQPKIHHTGSKARVRVRPGESAVMGYYEIEPGKLGLTMVTPEPQEGGQVMLQIRTIEMADSEDLRSRAQDILPDIFDLDRSGVVTPARMNELLRWILRNENAKTVNYPRMVTRPGQPCTIKSLATSPGAESLGTTYAVQADVIPGAEGFDLSVDYHRSGTRSEE